MSLDRRHILLLCVLASALVIFSRVYPRSAGGNIDIQIVKQRGEIPSLDTPRKAASLRTVTVDRLLFNAGPTLRHAVLGDLGYNRDFFITAATTMNVISPGEYEFSVTSDDGYRLTLDGQILGEHAALRAADTDRLPATISAGPRRLQLDYFQAYGPLVLKLFYRRLPDGKELAVGEDSKDVVFSRDK